MSVSQQAGRLPTFVDGFTHSATADGTTTVAGQRWTRYLGADGSMRYLVRATSADTTIIGGAEPYGALETFVTTLTAQPLSRRRGRVDRAGPLPARFPSACQTGSVSEHQHHTPADWDERYSSSERIWSGSPNPTLVE